MVRITKSPEYSSLAQRMRESAFIGARRALPSAHEYDICEIIADEVVATTIQMDPDIKNVSGFASTLGNRAATSHLRKVQAERNYRRHEKARLANAHFHDAATQEESRERKEFVRSKLLALEPLEMIYIVGHLLLRAPITEVGRIVDRATQVPRSTESHRYQFIKVLKRAREHFAAPEAD
jgi:hypothetical protein